MFIRKNQFCQEYCVCEYYAQNFLSDSINICERYRHSKIMSVFHITLKKKLITINI